MTASWSEEQKVIGSTAVVDDNIVPTHPGTRMGYRSIVISASGDTLAVGASEENDHKGIVYIFTRSGTTWSEQAILTPDDYSGTYSRFGFSLAISDDGNTLAIGGPLDGSTTFDVDLGPYGSVWVYTRSGTTWTKQVKLESDRTGAEKGNFGFGLSLTSNGTRLAVGDPNDRDGNPSAGTGYGAVYVFDLISGSWTQTDKFWPSDPSDTSPPTFGSSVAFCNSEKLVIGGPRDDNYTVSGGGSVQRGAVWTYLRQIDGTWNNPSSKLATTGTTGSDGSRAFGSQIDATENRLIVSGWRISPFTVAIWIYTKDTDSTWTLDTSFDSPYTANALIPDVSLSDDGNIAIVGAGYANDVLYQVYDDGGIWAYEKSSGSWSQIQDLLPGDLSGTSSQTGLSVDINSNGTRIVFSGPGDDNGKGAAWIYRGRLAVSLDGVFVPITGT